MKRSDSRWLLLLLACAALLSLHKANAEEPFQCNTSDTTFSTSSVDTFFAFIPGAPQSHVHRDLEFQWSDEYSHDLPTGVRTALNYLGANLASTSRSHNAFNAPLTNFNLIYDTFLGANRALYDSTVTDSIGFVIGCWPCSTPPLPIRDNAHLDVYLYKPGQGTYGKYPSEAESPWEDVSTEHSVGNFVHTNSVSVSGPAAGDEADTLGIHWTRPNWKTDTVILHEFQHAMPYKNIPGFEFGRDEHFSAMAEALSGGLYYRWEPERGDIPHAFSLLREGNYEHWRYLGAYLGFNFRGQDTTRVVPADSTGTSGFGDDLVWKWARTARGLNDLRNLLSDDNCWDCAQKSYFNGLSDYERLQLLLHNWRVANYVNAPSLLEGQYGYNQAFGAFSPALTRGAFTNHYHSCGNDSVAMPTVLTARAAWASQDTTIVGRRYDADCTACGQPCSRVMALEPFGSDYWVIKSEDALSSGNQDLVVRITPEGLARFDSSYHEGPFKDHDGRLMATVVTYTNQCDTLWNHPAWADSVFGPQIMDADSAGRALEFVLRDFGGSGKKAALVVLSLEDGPKGTGDVHGEPPLPWTWLPYRMDFALAKSPYATPFSGASANPIALAQTSSVEAEPAWSPDGTEIAYASAEVSPGRKILRRAVSGGSATKVHDVWEDQYQPDWSPRGDWIAFAQDSSIVLDDCRQIVIKNLSSSEVRKVSAGKVFCAWPAFQPNGQRLVYAYQSRPDPPASHSGWSIRRYSLDGSVPATLVEFAPGASPGDNALRSLRWSAAGDSVFFTRNDSLYVVSADGGTASYRGAYVSGRSIATFDLPRGNGAIAFEEPGEFTSGNQYLYWPQAYRRIALANRSVSPPDIEARFYRTGAEFYEPRWAPDGVRLAYRSSENGTGNNGDIFLGLASFNHAPVFNSNVKDTVVTAGVNFTLSLTATDEDGDNLSYQGLYLPSGGSVNGSTFTWTSPTLSLNTYYAVFRALDPGGGVAQKVVKLQTRPNWANDLAVPVTGRHTACVTWTEPAQGGGQPDEFDLRQSGSSITENNFYSATRCIPTPSPAQAGTNYSADVDSLPQCSQRYFAVKSRKGSFWSAISSVASGSTQCSGGEMYCEGDGLMAGGGDPDGSSAGNSLNAASSGLVVNGLSGLAGPVGDDYRGWLRVASGSEGDLDQVVLGTVDHDSDLGAFVIGSQVVLGTTGPVQSVLDETDSDVSSEVDGTTRGYVGGRGGTLTVSLGDSVDSATLLVIESAGSASGPADSSGIQVLVPDMGDAWTEVAHIHPHRAFAAEAVDVQGVSVVRLMFVGSHAIRSLKRLEASETVTPQALTLNTAVQSQVGDVKEVVAGSGGGSASLTEGDTLTMAFDTTAVATGKTRELFLGVKGSVGQTSTQRRGGGVAPVTMAKPTYVFSLGPARPNPTRGTVTIGYTLAQRSAVSLRIYDVAGRLVKTLVSGTGEAGPHEVGWNGATDDGRRVGAGVYFYKMTAGSWQSQRKVVFLER